MRLKTILIAVVAAVGLAVVGLAALVWLSPSRAPRTAAAPPPLPAVTRSSTIIAPITIPLAVIRDGVEKSAPRTFAGKANNPVPQLLQNGDIGWNAARGPIAASGGNNTLTFATPLTGTVTVNGALNVNKETLGGALGNLLGGNVAKQLGNIQIKNFNANADLRGDVTITAKPVLDANWRIAPNLQAQVNLGDTALTIAGARVNVPNEVKPTLDRAINDQLAALQQRLQNDRTLEQAARAEWAKLCQVIALPPVAAGQPPLWLEMRPKRAIAAQPRVDAANLVLTLGMEAETRILPEKARIECPFPAALDIVAAPSAGAIRIGVPIDIPFTTLNKLIETQLKGQTFPQDGDAAVKVTVHSASVMPAGDRLLVTMKVSGTETKSFLGLNGDATVLVWGRPVVDPQQQLLKLTDLDVEVQSEAMFGLLGSVARAAMPFLRDALSERATIDLKPLAATARGEIAKVIGDLQKTGNGARVNADVTDLHLADIAFDAKTLRVIAEVNGTAGVTVSTLPGL